MEEDEIADAMRRLNAPERAHRRAVDDLIRLRVVRSRRLVADLGEELASRYYGVPLASNANERGFDLIASDGRRIQVRALRSEPSRERTLMGVMREPYDALFAVKFTVDYEPRAPSKCRGQSSSATIRTLRAIEVPRAVLERHYPHGARTSWTKRLEYDDGVTRIARDELGD
jgi:hypothetical protein